MQYKEFFVDSNVKEKINIPSKQYSEERKRMLEETRLLVNKINRENSLDESIYMRKDMPQIQRKDLQKAMNLLKSRGIRVKKGRGIPKSFKPSQKDIYKEKVLKILKDPRSKDPNNMKPFIVSRDNYLVDGHHRWAAMKIMYPNHKFVYYKIDLPIQQAIDIYHEVAGLIKK